MEIISNIPDHVMNLPTEFEPEQIRMNVESGIPDIESLTGEQRIAFDTIIAFLNDELPDDLSWVRILLLEGYAGTGKTYLITQVIKWYILMKQNQIGVTAPTNKAVKVLKRTANFEHRLMTFATLHKLLGLKEDYDLKTGKLQFKKEYGEDSKLDEIDFLNIDEGSMLPDDLFHMIEPEVDRAAAKPKLEIGKNERSVDYLLNNIASKDPTEKNPLKLVIMGDPIQIPPVNKPDAIPFNPGKQEEFGIYRIVLTEVIRQKEGNPILELATIVRQNYQKSYLPYPRESVATAQGGIYFISAKDKATLYRLCENYFSNPRFEYDSDFIKVIAWTNVAVDFMNEKIRQYVYKEQYSRRLDQRRTELTTGSLFPDESAVEHELKKVKLPRLLVGEKLIADAPIIEDAPWGKKTVFNTNDEFEVLSFDVSEENVFANYKVNYYNTKVQYIDYGSGKSKTEIIKILHDSSFDSFSKVVDQLKKAAMDEKDPDQKRQKWKVFYMIKDKYANVKYNYAITAHKAQGSTYQNAIVIVADIDKNKNTVERNRIKYVAFTRAKENLFIVE